MKTLLSINKKNYEADLTKALDVSMPLKSGEGNPLAWYVDPMKLEPVMTEHFTGDVNKGGSVNFRNITFNPHGNGTHTECVGHISKKFETINQTLTSFFFPALVVSISPEQLENGDHVITIRQLENIDKNILTEALLIRTLPNEESKKHKNYSNTNPAFLESGAGKWLRENGVKHFLIDTPSVDKEFDEGKLINHHQYWNYPETENNLSTITELIFISDTIKDGLYLLNLMIAPFENDASPSKPILYPLTLIP